MPSGASCSVCWSVVANMLIGGVLVAVCEGVGGDKCEDNTLVTPFVNCGVIMVILSPMDSTSLIDMAVGVGVGNCSVIVLL